MKRKIYEKLINWKHSKDRKPLILQGARQVGKTYIVNIFASNEYKNYIYVNFEKDVEAEGAFTNLKPEDIIEKLSYIYRQKIFKNETLIIFDEIQFSKKALTSLKYFNEEANEYHIIALGSLLGIALNREEFSFPVGKVNFMEMNSMDFEEFLIALGEDKLISLTKDCYDNNTKMDDLYHNKLISFYKDYLYIGGMPECVNEFINNKNLNLVRIKQKEILEAYISDMSKYNKKIDIEKTRVVYNSLSTILFKENTKFQYTDIKERARAKDYENATNWIDLSGIAKKVYKLDDIKIPLDAHKNTSIFKFYMNDVGLLLASKNVLYEDIIYGNELINDYKGGITENYVFTQLYGKLSELYYYKNKYMCEVDFITRIKHDIVPIEVKSSINNRSKSLQSYIDSFHPNYSIRMSLRNFGFENGIKSVPLYAAFCI